MGRTDDLNEERMRLLGGRLADLSMVESVRYFPSEKPDRIVTSIGTSYYPDVVDGATLELRLRLNGDFNFQYREEWAGERWSCRWDRHPNAHNTRDHFHVPPRPHEGTAIDAVYPTDPNDVLGRILRTIDERINDLWVAIPEPTFPTEYEFAYEFGVDYLSGRSERGRSG